jgi:predicted transposase YdaD
VTEFDLSAQPNDAFFKAVFSSPERAAALFQGHLPGDLAALLDWPSLTLLPGSFVRQSLQQAHSDLLFSMTAHKEKVLLYLLFEHQTSVDPAMPLRLLAYIMDILLRHEKEHGLPLPPVIGFVLHQGPETWNVSPCFEHLFDIPTDLSNPLQPFLPKFRHVLLDLSRYDPAEEEDRDELRVVLQLMKLARQKRLLEFFTWLAGLQRITERLPPDLLRLAILYALHADASLDVKEITRNLEANPELQKTAMSVAEQLISQGRAEGRIEGRAEGTWIGKLHALEELLGIPVTPRDELAQLAPAELEKRYRERQRDCETRFEDRR